MLAVLGLLTPQTGQEFPWMQANQWQLRTIRSASVTRVSPMRKLFSPVNAGVSAARHVLWYLSYHTAPRQRH
jgi:hypothetical protein